MTRSLAAVAGLLLATSHLAAQTAFLIRDVRVFDGERTSEHRSVLVANGTIAGIGGRDLAAPSGAAVIDGRGRTLLPGLMDGHVHLSDSVEADLRQAISFGVTTVFDMFNYGDRYERIRRLRAEDGPSMADVRTAGLGAYPPGGHPSQMGGPPTPTIADSASADGFVAARFSEGSDYLKVIFDDLAGLGMSLPMLDRATLAGLIEATHRRGGLAVVHIGSEAQARIAITAGADGLVHAFPAASVAPDFGAFVRDHGAFVVPTLTIHYGLCEQPIGPTLLSDSLLTPFIRPAMKEQMGRIWKPRGGPSRCEGTADAIRQLSRAGATIVTGTDAPSPGQSYGISVHGELALLVRAGLTPVQALTAATAGAARAFRLSDRGRIREGLRADLLLVEGNPAADITATRRIVAIWKKGIPVERRRYQP